VERLRVATAEREIHRLLIAPLVAEQHKRARPATSCSNDAKRITLSERWRGSKAPKCAQGESGVRRARKRRRDLSQYMQR
jgi:hypothetical protein